MMRPTDPAPVRVDELRADYVAALRRAARAESQQLERRATITRRQFLALSWHGEPNDKPPRTRGHNS
jgi:hypothetical protein